MNKEYESIVNRLNEIELCEIRKHVIKRTEIGLESIETQKTGLDT